jgi:hypothetical protein
MDIGVQIRNAVLLHGVHERRHALAGGVIGAVTSTVVRSIAVDVHVNVLAAVCGAVKEDGPLNIAAVGEGPGAADAVGEAVLQLVLACSGLTSLVTCNGEGAQALPCVYCKFAAGWLGQYRPMPGPLQPKRRQLQESAL